MKILFLMDSPEYLRFYDSAISELAARGHAVAIAVNNQRDKKPVGIEGLRTHSDCVTVLGVVPQSTGVWSHIAYKLRGTMDFLRFLHPSYVGAPALRARIKRKVLPRAYHWLDAIPHLTARTVHGIERALMAADRAIPVEKSIVDFLRAQAPDVLLISPLVNAASDQVDWVKAANLCGIRSGVCIASWDNLTNKGLLRIEPDLVIVWNEAQRREAHEYHYIALDRVAATGAQLFDKWFEKKVTRDRDAFCRAAGLPEGEPFVLFTGSSSFISESSAEVAFVRRWIGLLRSSPHPELRAINVLVRPHPYNFHRWADNPVADLPRVAVYPPQPYNPVDASSRDDFFDSLYHCAVVVGINTSAMIEAAIIGRPVCSMLAPEFAGTQEGTIHFHHLLPEQGGFLRIASTIDQHVEQLRGCLRNPAMTRAETERFVASFVRPHGTERAATPIFADVVERLSSMPHRAATPPPFAPALRVLLLVAALPSFAADRLQPQVRARLRKRIGSAARRAGKRIKKTGARWRRLIP
jgi:hypothetical protein